MNLEHGRLRQLLHYDPLSGIFIRRSANGTAKVGDIAGCKTKKGYTTISVDGIQILAHRLAWFYMNRTWPVHHTDHVNGVKTDNRAANLRLATASENIRNYVRHELNTSGVRGVYWSNIRQKWVAQISINRKAFNLGGFTEMADAIAAREAAEDQYFGDYKCRR